MEWQPSSSDLNLIKNLWSLVKMKLYNGSKPYNSKTDLWEAIKTSVLEIEPAEVKMLMKSKDNKLLVVIENKSHYIIKCKGFKDLCSCYLFSYRCWSIFLWLTSPGGNTPQGTNHTATGLLSWKLSKLDEPDMQDTAGEAGTSS